MLNTVSATLAGLPGELPRNALSPILRALADRMSSQATATAGLVITAALGTAAKIGATAFQGVANGKPVTIAAGTVLPALVGTGTAGAFNIFAFFVDAAGVVTVAKGVEGSTLAKASFPTFPEGKALIGYLIITSAGAFVGGTTALDTATTIYVSPIGAFDPTITL